MTGAFSRLVAVLLCVLIASETALAPPTGRVTNLQALQKLEEACSQQFRREQATAAAWARRNGVPMREKHADGHITELFSISGGSPLARTTLNASAADSVSVDELWPGGATGLNLSGAGVVLHEWDAGGVRTSHVELTGVTTWADDTSPGYSSHSTHVAGTMVGLGIVPAARGMAWGATLHSYDWSDDNAEMAAAAAAGARVSNHSYGWIRGWYWYPPTGDWYWFGDPTLSQTEDSLFGFYDDTARTWDDIAFNAPGYLIVKSAGNDRGDAHVGGHWVWSAGTGWVWSTQARDADGGVYGYDTIGQQGCAKNILTVGAVRDVPGGYSNPAGVGMTSFSGWGPTDDGRIKPDIVANGYRLYSSVASSDVGYASYSGTSMASPTAAGSLGLFIQHYRAAHGGADMTAATVKGLVIHTADEAGSNPGPDYQFGWGLLNARAAAEHISRDQAEPEAIQELILSQGQTIRQVYTSDGTTPLRVTISWTDPAGTPVAPSLDPPNPMLVNDLDVTVTDQLGNVRRAWTLNPANPAAAATRGDNVRDNVEMVLVDPAPVGLFTIKITHKGTLVNGSQDFSMILSRGSGSIGGCPAGEIPDCNGNCGPVAWVGDGFCDDGARLHNGSLIDFSCSAYNIDGGDCSAAIYPQILWRNDDTGENDLWFMDGMTVLPESGALPTVRDLNWTVVGSGDFDGDGQTDYLWRHWTKGYNVIWFMRGLSLVPDYRYTSTVKDLDWSVVGIRDFDGDGKADILWRHQVSGRVYLWFMDGVTRRSESGSLPTVGDLRWMIVGTGDFDGDGKADILWRHRTAGYNAVWFMDGTNLRRYGVYLTTVRGGWNVVSAEDFDGDGKTDILWRNDDGLNALWFMDGVTRRAEAGLLPTVSDLDWTVAGLRDFDGDGYMDILWRHLGDGSNEIWFMTGTSLVPDRRALPGTGTNWSAVATGE